MLCFKSSTYLVLSNSICKTTTKVFSHHKNSLKVYVLLALMKKNVETNIFRAIQ